MIILAQIAFAVFSSIAIYGAAVVLWSLGCYLAVFPFSGKPYNFSGLFLPPIVLPITYLVWLGTVRFHPSIPLHPGRRLVQLAIAAGVSVLFACLDVWWSVGSNSLPAVVAAGLMTSVSAITLIADRDVNLALLIVISGLIGIVPIVVAGRVLALAIGTAVWGVWSVIRTLANA